MHNFERVLLPLLDKVLGKQGLAHELTTSQGMYKVNYYWVKFRNMLDTLTIDSFGGDVTQYLDAPPSIKNLVGEIARTRWVSAERTSDKVIDALNEPASELLIEKISNYFGGVESDEWIEGCKYCTCMSSDKLSHLMLAFWWLANHTPGGKKGMGLVGCISIIGFLGTPYHRVCLKIAAALYPIHIKWSKFSDRSSEIGIRPQAISTRSIENAIFERNFIREIHHLCTEWSTFLPDVNAYILSEATRALSLGLIEDENIFLEFFNNLMIEGCKGMMEMTSKYFYQPGLRLGWSLLQVVDPYVGPNAAGAILCVLRKMNLINIDPSIKDEQLLVDNNLVNDENDNEWRVSSNTHSFPGVTMQMYQNTIMESFLNADVGVAPAVVNAYGLSNPFIIEELLQIASGKLLINLIDNNNLLQNNEKWCSGDELKKYWPLFEKTFPYLHDTLIVNFQTRPITSTTAEQTFSMTATQVRPNNSASTNSKNMNHAQTVKGAILREMYDFKESHNNGPRKRAQRSSQSRHQYLSKLSVLSNLLSSTKCKIPSVREIRGKGKKISELVDVYEHSKNEMSANEKTGGNIAGGECIMKAVRRASTAKENNLDFIEIEVDKLEEKAKKMTVKELKDALKVYCPGDKTIQVAIKGDVTKENSLMYKIIDYWKKNGIEE